MISGEKILITGPAGQVTFPITQELAKNNETWGMARFSNPADREKVEALGVTCVQRDLSESFDGLPTDFTYVFHAGAVVNPTSELDWDYTFKVNAHAVGRLMSHCRNAKGFLHCSTSSIYEFQGETPVKESDPLGLHIPCYSFSKIAAESVARFASEELNLPTMMIRIASFYGPSGGAPARRLDMLVRGDEIPLSPHKPNYFRPIYVDDGVELGIKAMTMGTVPATSVNWCGNDIVSAEEYCAYLGQLLGLEPKFKYTDSAYTGLVPDTTYMHEILGRCKVHWKEGMQRLIKGRHPELEIKGKP